ncbi:MAG: DNA primase [Candidatus Gracilibacteria bacterium]|nr:DNA primase [Candidatus Gracilibacteria bacterium]
MSQIEELESSIDIVELVKKYTNLKKAGVNYKALCPFPGHNEKTPSFVVSPSKQIAHCFGCQRGGGPLKFIMDVENCEFREALEILSNITGMKITGYDREKEQMKKNVYSLFRDIVTYYKKSLSSYPQIQKYLFDRGLSEESIKTFEFGYADSGIELYNYLIQKGYNDELISQSNVFLDLKTKKDKFIGRIIFPIKNIRGDIVALAGRIIESGEPKYLNSPASNIYDKSSILYGLFEARNEITKKDFVIITEGYMDTISLHRAGFKNTVCVSGVALTEKHIAIIKKLTSKIYLCFDNDKAGINATNLSIERLKNKDLEVHIISLEGGKDPDDIIKSGIDFNIFIKNALSPIGYNLKLLQINDSLQDKKELLKKLLDIVKNYQDSIEKDFYLKEISKKLDIKIDIVYLEYNKTKLAKREDEFSVKILKKLTSEDLVIGYLIKYQDKFDFIKQNIKFKNYIGNDLKEILEKGINIINEFELSKKNKYISISQNDEALEIRAQIENQVIKNDEKIENIILKTIDKLNSNTSKEAETILKQKIASGDTEALNEYKELLKVRKR